MITINQNNDNNSKLVNKQLKLENKKKKKIAKLELKKTKLNKQIVFNMSPKKRTEIEDQIRAIDLRITELNNNKITLKNSLKIWSKGIAKESRRIIWEKKWDIIKNFVTIVVITIILASIFFGIDILLLTIKK